MTGSALGGGVIFVIAALLWAAVLVPIWVRRREFQTAERNALRLQRTLRVLAETAEVPEEVRVEATARQALAHEKLLRTAQKRQEAEREAELAEARAEQVRAELRAQEAERREAATARLARLTSPAMRRVRASAAVLAALGLVGVLVGAGLAFAQAGFAVLGAAALALTLGLGTLLLLAPGRVKADPVAADRPDAAPRPTEHARSTAPEPHATGESDEAAAAHAAAQQAAAARIARAQALARARAAAPAERVNQRGSILLEEAAAETAASHPSAPATGAATTAEPATRAIPAAEARPATRETRRAPAPSAERAHQLAAAARLREMGVVGDTSEGLPDLDEVLRRRRSAS